jgi:hypothetical protein
MKFKALKLNGTGLKTLFSLLIIFFLFFGTAVSSSNAEVTNWEVHPENPKSGDTLVISGFASPEEEVEVSISFEKKVPVYLKEYTYELENIEILNFNNLFTVRAEGVENLKVKMKMIFSKTESSWAEDGTATVSYSEVSPGEYKVRIEGTAEDRASDVNLKVTTVQRLKAGKDGKFSYIYKTESAPSGKIEIGLGNSEKEIIFDAKGSNSILQDIPDSSQIEASVESGDRKASEPMVLTDKGSTDQVDRENVEKSSIYLTESSWDENNTLATTAGEVPSKELEREQENKEHENKVINFFYVLAGAMTGFGGLLTIRRKK